MDGTTHAPGSGHASARSQQRASSAYDRFAAATAVPANDERIDILVFWEEEIRSRLHDQELRDSAARGAFEARIVQRLAAGWQPGSDALFCAATLVFQWPLERARLASFGEAGRVVSRAIDERAMFEAQSEPERSLHRKVMARLADPEPPAYYQLERYLFHVDILAQRFPHLLAVCVSQATVARWRAVLAGLYSATPEMPGPAAAAAAEIPAPQPASHGFARLLQRMFRHRG